MDRTQFFFKLFLIIQILGAYHAMAKRLLHCDNDSACKVGEYCLHKSGQSICQKCEDCLNYYYKEVGSGRSCARSGYECGPCLPGYSLLKQADHQVSPRCTKNHFESAAIIASASTVQEIGTNSMTNIVIPICLVFMIIGVLIAVIWNVWWVKKRSRKNHVLNTISTDFQQQPLVKTSCPESSSEISFLEPKEWISTAKDNVFRVATLENDLKTQATPYQVPNYVPDELPIPMAMPVFNANYYHVVTQPAQEIRFQTVEHPISVHRTESESENEDWGSDFEQNEDQDFTENPDFTENDPNGPAAAGRAGRRHIRQQNAEISLLRISIHNREEINL